jgi:hypothetical protein
MTLHSDTAGGMARENRGAGERPCRKLHRKPNFPDILRETLHV